MILSNEDRQPKPFTGWHMLACMVAFFGVIIVVNFTMAYLASGSWTGLVVKNSYVASQKFNSELERAKEQRHSGLRSSVAIEGQVFRVQFQTVAGAIGNVDQAELWVGRPVSEHQDRTLALICNPASQCDVPLRLEPGLWSIKLNAQVDGMAYRRDMRVEVGNDETIRID